MSNDNPRDESLEKLVAELRADRLKEKEKAEREAWTRHTSLSLVLIAVLAAVATQWAGKYSTRTLTRLNEATYFQSKASDAREW